MKRTRTLAAVAAVGALVAAGATASPATAGESKRKVERTQPSWVSHTRSTGKAPGSGRSAFKVYLQPRGGMSALQAAADAIATPGSPSYHHFVTPAQFHAQFDPSADAVDQVSGWLRSQGLKVTGTGAHHDYVAASGTNDAVGAAFSTQIRQYAKDGTTVQANDSEVSVPDSIAGMVSTVSGLDTSAHPLRPAAKPSPYPPGFRNAQPCSAYYGQKPAAAKADGTPLPKFQGKTIPYSPCGYVGPQFRGAYENNSTQDGSGVTIAITDAYASPTIAADARRYAGAHGDRTYAQGQLTQTTPAKYAAQKQCDAPGWYGEETLDVEAAHAMAQGSDIAYYAAASCNDDDFLDTLDRVVEDNRASIVSNSWGGTELNSDVTLETEYNKTFLQGGMQGISFLFSSGDDGDEVASSGVKQADAEGNNPNVTAVGGTADAINQNNRFAFQTGWGSHKWSLSADGSSWTGDTYLYGAGGGVSTIWRQPAYQKGVVPAQFSSGRAEPDVAMDADPTTGMLVGETQAFPDGNYYDEYRIGGTSLASPLFAGLTALRQQAAGPGYDHRLGFLNPSIYQQRSKFTDIQGTPPDPGNVRADYANGIDPSGGMLYTVRTFNQDSSLQTAPGWDEVTGVGAGTAAWTRP